MLFLCFLSGVPGVGAAVQGVQVAAEQGLSAAFTKVQVCLFFERCKRSIIRSFVSSTVYDFSPFFTPAAPQELTGQQQTSSQESEFEFPADDDVTFASSEFGEEAAGFPAEPAGSGHGAAGASQSAAGGKQALFEGYSDPSKQFGGHTRSYHRDARYGRTPFLLLIRGGKSIWTIRKHLVYQSHSEGR